MASDGSALAPGTTLGRYVLEKLLGEGGMGAVYAAKHLDLGKVVAIKTLHPQYAQSGEVRARFIREGQSASRIRHPNVVDVYDAAVEGDTPYLVMEFLNGEDLAHLIRREGPLAPQRVADIMLPTIAAVAAANDLGIVHRDLKPENVFLSLERKLLKPKVVDFGISKVTDQENNHGLTSTSALLGTPYYMSPEQAVGAKYLDHRTDQYSLGVILYECVTARKPIEDATLYALMHKIVTGDFAPPRHLNPTVPEELERIILRAMSREAGQRFASTRALGCALLPFASERQRALYSEELMGEAPGTASADAASSLPFEATAVGQATGISGSPAVSGAPSTTTLGHSAHQRDVAPAAPRRTPWVPIAAGVIALGAGAWFVAGGRLHPGTDTASATSALTTAAELPSLATSPTLTPSATASAPTLESPLPSANVQALPSAAPSASAKASTPSPRPQSHVAPVRPGLAPR